MPLTDEQKTLITAMVGDVDVNGRPVTDSTGVIATYIDTIEEEYEGRPTRLQFLYTHRDCIDLVLARLKNKVNTQLGNLQLSKSQSARTLLQMRSNLVTRIAAVERAQRANGTAIGLITRKQTIEDETERLIFVADLHLEPHEVV